jgi:antirestriction protein ArdC
MDTARERRMPMAAASSGLPLPEFESKRFIRHLGQGAPPPAPTRRATPYGWLTYKQAAELGGNVRKGEHGTMIVYIDRFVPKAERIKAAAEGREPRLVPMLKSYFVFNVAQCENLPHRLVQAAPRDGSMILPQAEAVIRATGATIRLGHDRAFYVPDADYIAMPHPSAFEPDVINWHRTAFHELGHWTGHKSRLDREFHSFGSKAYAKEELIAEMSAAFCCASLGIEPTVRHADYIGTWLAVLKEDNRAVVRAASAHRRLPTISWHCRE